MRACLLRWSLCCSSCRIGRRPLPRGNLPRHSKKGHLSFFFPSRYIGDNQYIGVFSPYWLSPITSFHHIGDNRYYRDILESITNLIESLGHRGLRSVGCRCNRRRSGASPGSPSKAPIDCRTGTGTLASSCRGGRAMNSDVDVDDKIETHRNTHISISCNAILSKKTKKSFRYIFALF